MADDFKNINKTKSNSIADGTELSEKLKALSGVDGISMENGLEFCGNAPAFIKFLTTFYKSIDSKSKEIEDAYNIEDYDFYTIKVHALKSTARIIGATELSELALSLEEAGNDRNLGFITDNTERLLDMYRSYKERLSVLDETRESDIDKNEISLDELKDAYGALVEVVSVMDYDSAEIILEGIKKYRLSKEEEACIERIEDLLNRLEWDQLKDYILSFDSPEEKA